jgi:hypothetical protein
MQDELVSWRDEESKPQNDINGRRSLSIHSNLNCAQEDTPLELAVRFAGGRTDVRRPENACPSDRLLALGHTILPARYHNKMSHPVFDSTLSQVGGKVFNPG